MFALGSYASSEITWTATYTGPAVLGVAQYSNGVETFTLAF